MAPETQGMFDTDELVINMGPQHPSTHGVLRVVLRLDGERVVGSDVVIGYLHRGIEKLCESRDYAQIVLITDRMDYVAAATSNLGYCETVEKLMSIEVPRRARTCGPCCRSCSGSRATASGWARTPWTSGR